MASYRLGLEHVYERSVPMLASPLPAPPADEVVTPRQLIPVVVTLVWQGQEFDVPAAAEAWTASQDAGETSLQQLRTVQSVKSAPSHVHRRCRASCSRTSMFGTARDGRLFRGKYGGRLGTASYTKVWRRPVPRR
jgi:hypothetical protein